MRSVTIAADAPERIEFGILGGTCHLYLRKDAREVSDEDGQHWEYSEAYMEMTLSEAPAAAEIEEDFEAWFEYAASWKRPETRSRAQLQADVDYLAALIGADLEV